VMSMKATAVRGRLADTPAGRHWQFLVATDTRAAPTSMAPTALAATKGELPAGLSRT
jgi:hypothetical protein